MVSLLKDISLDFIGFGVGAGLSISFYVLLKTGQKIVEDIQNTLEVNIDRELLKKLKKEEALDVCISGKVFSDDTPIHSINNPKVSGVIWKYTIKEHIIAQILGMWTDDKKIIDESVRTVPFSLIGNGIRVKVSDPLKLESLDLSVVDQKFVSAKNSLADHLWGYMKGIRSTGTEYKEEMLVEGTQVIAIGKLLYEKGVLNLKPHVTIPYILTTRSKQDVIEDFEEPTIVLRILALLSACGAAYFAYRIILKLHKRWREYRKEREEAKVLSEVKQMREVMDFDIPESLMCLVCCGLRDILLMPCKHICICGDCYQKLNPKICPVCRSEVETIQPVFYS